MRRYPRYDISRWIVDSPGENGWITRELRRTIGFRLYERWFRLKLSMFDVANGRATMREFLLRWYLFLMVVFSAVGAFDFAIVAAWTALMLWGVGQ